MHIQKPTIYPLKQKKALIQSALIEQVHFLHQHFHHPKRNH